MNAAAAHLPTNGRILEIGSGPGTATLPLLKRGFHVTCIEPSSAMIHKAKQVCREYMNDDMDMSSVTFHQATLEEFVKRNQGQAKYDAIVAATSFHWAMDRQGGIVKQCHELLRSNGQKLVLLWNIPPEPNQDVSDAVANALGKDTPFFFSSKSREQHKLGIRETILAPVSATGLFTEFSTQDFPTESTVPISDFLSMVRTFSHYIRIPDEERATFFDIAETTMTAKCGTTIDVSGLSLLNVSTKVNDVE
jgi:SAM-dependent methyltransferase